MASTPILRTDSSFSQSRDLSSSPRRGRRGSTTSVASLTSSLGVSPDSRIREVGNNAISKLVENNSARSVPARPTTRDIPAVTLTSIPKVKFSEFQPYLAITAEYERYMQAKEHNMQELLRMAEADKSSGDSNTIEWMRKNSEALSPNVSRRESLAVPGQGTPPQDPPSRKSSLARRQSIAATPLNTVPAVYFDENFHLENPRTFDVVSERSQVIQPPEGKEHDDEMDGRKALATNAILQEKLSWYMDTVEVHLIKEISAASSGFFAALGSLRELHAEATASVQKIQGLREDLAKLDREQAMAGLEIVRLRRRRANVEKLASAVKQIAQVLDKTARAEDHLDKDEVFHALRTIEDTEDLISGNPPSAIDLHGVKVLEIVRSELTHLRYKVGKGYEQNFVDILLSDLRTHANSVAPSDTLLRFHQMVQRQNTRISSSEPLQSPRAIVHSYNDLPKTLKASLLVNLDGLKRAQHVEGAVQAYQNAVMKETKSIIKRNMPGDDDAVSVMSGRSMGPGSGRTTAEKSSSLARSLRSLGPRDAEDMVVRVYTSVSEVLRRLGAQQKLLLDITSGMDSVLSPRNSISFPNGMVSSPPSSPPPSRQAQAAEQAFMAFYSMDISEIISVAIDTAQHQMVKVLKVRSEQNSHLPLGDFLRFLTLNKLFSAECEALSGKITTSLQSVVGNQIKDFIFNFHQENLKQLALVIEKDKWDAKDFDAEAKDGLDRVLDAATRDAENWSAWGKVYEDPPLPPPKEERNGDGTTTKIRTAIIDEQRFILPESAIAVLKSVESYECLMSMIPGSTADIATNLIEFLKLFNSRTCQVILGAGATKSAGLKHITTKHLALASQAISIVVAVIPYARECVRRHLGSGTGGTLIPEFDRLKRNFQEHQSEIHSKLISIMSDRLTAHIRVIRGTLDWDAPPTDASKPNAYMETLVKETSTLHRVLSKHLPEVMLLSIMQPVFNTYKKRLIEAYQGVNVKTEGGKERMLRDAQFFKERMSKIDGCEEAGDAILEAAKNKTLNSATTATPAANAPSGSNSNSTVTSPQPATNVA